MKKPNKAMIDGDIIAWKVAFVADIEGVMSIGSLITGLLNKWTPDCCDGTVIALSCPKSDNFRRDVYPGYKENREDAYKPEFLKDVFDFLIEEYDYMILPKLEADDILGIYASNGDAIAVTIDKDLKGVHGWHYNPNKDKEIRYVSKEEAYEFFCKQWMMGDSTDGIPGLWKIGPKKAEKFLSEWDKDDWEQNIIDLYDTDKHKVREDCDIPHPDIAIVMARCVKILTKKEYNLNKKQIKLWCPKSGS